MDELTLGDNGEKGVIDVTCVRMYRPGDPEVEETQPLLEKKGIKSFDEALDSTGVGFFHVLLILVSGWALASDSVEVQCISFVTPQLSADYGNPDPALDLDDFKKSLLDAIIFLGMMVGGYFWGSWSDIIGRRSCLVTSLTFNGVFGFASSLSPNFPVFLFFRFMSGVGVGGSLPVAFSYFCEFFSKKTRGPFVIVLAGFWIVGSIFASLLALGVIEPLKPALEDTKLGSIHITSWRVYVMLCTVPALSAAFCLIFLPESPSFLFSKGKLDKTLSALKLIKHMNSWCKQCYSPLESSIDYDDLERITKKEEEKESFLIKMKTVITSTLELFSWSYLRQSAVLCTIWFTFSFGYYGLLLWFPEYFKRIEQLESLNTSNGDANSSNISIYIDSVYTSLASIPGTILGILTVNLLGGKLMLTTSMCLCAVSSFLIRVVPTRERNIVILSCVFNGISIFGWNALDTISTSEIFPVRLRSTAFGIQAIFGRIGAILGNLAFGKLVDKDPMIPITMVAAFLLLGGLTALFLPSPPGEGIIQNLRNIKRKCHSCICRCCCRPLRRLIQ